jgi:hypothetical protein
MLVLTAQGHLGAGRAVGCGAAGWFRFLGSPRHLHRRRLSQVYTEGLGSGLQDQGC